MTYVLVARFHWSLNKKILQWSKNTMSENEWKWIKINDNWFCQSTIYEIVFYKCTLIVSRITQIDIHLRFCIIYNKFDHLKKLKNIIMINTIFLQCTIILKACQIALNKL